MRTPVAIVLTLIVALLVGFLLLDLVGILMSGSVSMLGTGQIIWRVAFVCAGVTLIVGVLVRSRSR